MDLKAISERIETALRDALAEMDDYEEGDLLIDWIVISYTDNPDSEKDTAYPMFFSNGEMPQYRALGLLETGIKLLDEVTTETDEE